MNIEGFTVFCDDCNEEFSEFDDEGVFEDETVCPVCVAKRYNNWMNSPCKICGKPLRENLTNIWRNADDDYAHEKCIKKLSEEQIEEGEWTDEYWC